MHSPVVDISITKKKLPARPENVTLMTSATFVVDAGHEFPDVDGVWRAVVHQVGDDPTQR
jgi:hypothetical protein